MGKIDMMPNSIGVAENREIPVHVETDVPVIESRIARCADNQRSRRAKQREDDLYDARYRLLHELRHEHAQAEYGPDTAQIGQAQGRKIHILRTGKELIEIAAAVDQRGSTAQKQPGMQGGFPVFKNHPGLHQKYQDTYQLNSDHKLIHATLPDGPDHEQG